MGKIAIFFFSQAIFFAFEFKNKAKFHFTRGENLASLPTLDFPHNPTVFSFCGLFLVNHPIHNLLFQVALLWRGGGE